MCIFLFYFSCSWVVLHCCFMLVQPPLDWRVVGMVLCKSFGCCELLGALGGGTRRRQESPEQLTLRFSRKPAGLLAAKDASYILTCWGKNNKLWFQIQGPDQHTGWKTLTCRHWYAARVCGRCWECCGCCEIKAAFGNQTMLNTKNLPLLSDL